MKIEIEYPKKMGQMETHLTQIALGFQGWREEGAKSC